MNEPAYSLSNVTGHMSSTWTALGLALSAATPLIAGNSMPTSMSAWIVQGGLLATAIAKALGR